MGRARNSATPVRRTGWHKAGTLLLRAVTECEKNSGQSLTMPEKIASNGFSFVISFETRSGPGLRGRHGYLASWRPIHQSRCAIKVGGSPFKTLVEAEIACTAMLAHLTRPG